MSDLTFLAPAVSFPALLNTSSTGGLTNILQVIQDGLGHNSPLCLSTDSININTQMGGGFFIDDVKLEASAEDINDICLLADFGGLTGALTLPFGTTEERPAEAIGGEIRYNLDSESFEGYQNGDWANFATTNAYTPGNPTYLQDTHGTTNNLSVGTNAPNFVGQDNCTFGDNIGTNGFNGNGNSFFGKDSSSISFHTIHNCSGFGYGALRSNQRDEISAFGFSALYNNLSGPFNCAFGSCSLYNNDSGGDNCSFGYESAYSNVSGNGICAFGKWAAYYATGDFVSAFGESVLENSPDGENCGFGAFSGTGLVSGTKNVFMGYLSGGFFGGNTFNQCIFIGSNCDAAGGGQTLTNAIGIGYHVRVSQDNSMILGNGVDVGIGTNKPNDKLHVVGTAQFQGITSGYVGSGVKKYQNGITTEGAGTNSIDFPILTETPNIKSVKVRIAVMNTAGTSSGYAESQSAAFWNGVTTASTGTLPTIVFTNTAGYAVAAAWSISGDNLRLTVTGVADNDSVWVITSETFSTTNTSE